MKRSKRRTWFIIIVTSAFLAWLYGPGSMKIVSLERQDAVLKLKIQQLEKDNTRLEERIQQLENDPLAVEREVRKKLGLTRENEITYKIIEPEDLRRIPTE